MSVVACAGVLYASPLAAGGIEEPSEPPAQATGRTSDVGAAPTVGTTATTETTKEAPAEVAARPAEAVATQVAPEPKPDPASLDLKALETRLRDTNAIGFFTKLSLKNQVDDLLARVRGYHNGGSARESLAGLREAFNLLLLKVLTLLQDDDKPLFTEISQSREALWALLADPNKFARL